MNENARDQAPPRPTTSRDPNLHIFTLRVSLAAAQRIKDAAYKDRKSVNLFLTDAAMAAAEATEAEETL